jgi:type III secretion protein S
MEVTEIFRQALLMIVMLSGPALAVAVVLGILVSVVQSLFQVQDQTLAFTLKLVAVSGILLMSAVWMRAELVSLANNVFEAMGNVGR